MPANNNRKKTKTLDASNLSEIYMQFTEHLPEESYRTYETSDTHDILITHGYQFVVNRLNEAVGIPHWNLEIVDRPDVLRRGQLWEVSLQIILSLGNWDCGIFIPIASRIAYGSGISATKGNALKGAQTNAFKKAAAMYGIGKKTYEGLIEDYEITRNQRITKVGMPPTDLPKQELLKVKELEKQLISVDTKVGLQKIIKQYKQIELELDPKARLYLSGLIKKLDRKLK